MGADGLRDNPLHSLKTHQILPTLRYLDTQAPALLLRSST